MSTHNERVLNLLSDGKPHGHMEIYRLGVVCHSRISDLRKMGHSISQRREGDLYLYQLRDASLTSAAAPSRRAPVEAAAVVSEEPATAQTPSLSQPACPESEDSSLVLFDLPAERGAPAWG